MKYLILILFLTSCSYYTTSYSEIERRANMYCKCEGSKVLYIQSLGAIVFGYKVECLNNMSKYNLEDLDIKDCE